MTSPLPDGLDPATRGQIEAVLGVVRDVLHGDALGVWLHGSAVHGGLHHRSDVDLLVASARAMTRVERGALIRGLLRLSGRRAADGPARPLEVTVVVLADVRPWRYPPPLELQYGDWWRREFERGDDAPWISPNPDLAVVLTGVIHSGVPLLGPAPGELLDPVPRADLDRAMLDTIPGLLSDLEPDTANVVLTLARIWVTLDSGEIRPKDAAADWVLRRLPDEHRAVLERARAVYLGDADDRWDDLAARVGPHAEHVVREIRAAAADVGARSADGRAAPDGGPPAGA
jgi:streptomycin 3"-adenylyltransferase